MMYKTKGEAVRKMSGVQGVIHVEASKGYFYWRAYLRIKGKVQSKSFPNTEEGKNLAIQWRRDKERLHGIEANSPSVLKKRGLTKNTVREIFDYREGKLYWKEGGTGIKGGALSRAGYLENTGYRRVVFNRKRYQEHNVIWLYCKGRHPVGTLVHINGDNSDNRIENLRDVDPNRRKSNTYKLVNRIPLEEGKIRGVCRVQHGKHPYWRAYINYRTKVYIKHYPYTEKGKQQAIQWRRKKEVKFYGKVISPSLITPKDDYNE